MKLWAVIWLSTDADTWDTCVEFVGLFPSFSGAVAEAKEDFNSKQIAQGQISEWPLHLYSYDEDQQEIFVSLEFYSGEAAHGVYKFYEQEVKP